MRREELVMTLGMYEAECNSVIAFVIVAHSINLI